jgi:hypothetical protein
MVNEPKLLASDAKELIGVISKMDKTKPMNKCSIVDIFKDDEI